MIDDILISLSNNKIFAGSILLMSNLGGRYLSIDFPKNVENIFTKYFVIRCMVLFSIFFMATRDIKISLLLSLLFFIIIYFFINENSTFCVIKPNDPKKITLEEYNKAKEIVNQFQKNI